MSDVAIDSARKRAILCAAIDAMYSYCQDHPSALEDGMWRLAGTPEFAANQIANLHEELQDPTWQPSFDFAAAIETYARGMPDQKAAENFRAASIHHIVAVVKKIMMGSAFAKDDPQPVILFAADDSSIFFNKGKNIQQVRKIIQAEKIDSVALQQHLTNLQQHNPTEYTAMQQLLFMHNQLFANLPADMDKKKFIANFATVAIAGFISIGLVAPPNLTGDNHAKKDEFARIAQQTKQALFAIKDFFLQPPNSLDYSVSQKYASQQGMPASTSVATAFQQELAVALLRRASSSAAIEPAVPEIPAGLPPPPVKPLVHPPLPPKPSGPSS